MEKYLYDCKDIMEIFHYSKSKASDVIRELNGELAEKGFRIVTGKIPRMYVEERYYGLKQALQNT